MADINKINWFPGHMAKSLRLLDDLKYIDLIIEVVDARAVSSSSNPMLKEKFGNKPVLTIALKTDLAIITKPVKNILYGSIYEKKFKNIFLKSIERELQEKKQRMINKGLVSPTFNLVVVGLPNIGKSSIINFLSGQTKAHAENKPGVTRKNTLIKINKELMIYDTPGIMVKNIIDIDVGYRLSLIGVINQNILPMRDVLEWWFNFVIVNFPNMLTSVAENTNGLTFEKYINLLCEKYSLFKQNNVCDIERAYTFLYKQIINGALGKINFEL